ncbi:MAG: copper amine oxidase N-terminal domain-containing protein, partial [Flavonifractor plautii]
MEGLGAEVAFDGSRIAAALENGDSLELVLGATELTVTQGGRITTLDMGAAPFVRDGHTYIPVRAAAEALGLDVYWDDTYEAAHLTDYAALTAELDSRFTAANGIWAAIRDTIPREAGKG